MNIVLGDATEEKSGNDSIDIGMVVSSKLHLLRFTIVS